MQRNFYLIVDCILHVLFVTNFLSVPAGGWELSKRFPWSGEFGIFGHRTVFDFPFQTSFKVHLCEVTFFLWKMTKTNWCFLGFSENVNSQHPSGRANIISVALSTSSTLVERFGAQVDKHICDVQCLLS